MLLSIPFQMAFLWLGAPGGLFVMTSLVMLALSPTVLMLTTQTPAVTLADGGFWLEPHLWRRRFITWEQVRAVHEYPLLPSANQEVQRRALVGRKQYKPAEGILLLIDGLPLQYGIMPFFAGQAGKRGVALTNRTHTRYDALKSQVVRHAGEVIPYD